MNQKRLKKSVKGKAQSSAIPLELAASDTLAGLPASNTLSGLPAPSLPEVYNSGYPIIQDSLANDGKFSKGTTAFYAVLDFASGIVFSPVWYMSIPDFLTASLRTYLILPICKDYLIKSVGYVSLAFLDVTKPFLGGKNISTNDLGEIKDGIETAADDLSNASEEFENEESKSKG